MGAVARLERGPEGAARGAKRGNVVVIVDTLSFSSAVATAVHHGSIIYPVAPEDDPNAIARDVGAVATVPRSKVTDGGQLSLSPVPYQFLPPGTKVAAHSPNGGGCCKAAAEAPLILAGCLLNASAVADRARRSRKSVTVVACGEIRRDGTRRQAEEDDLGAGAILTAFGRRLMGCAREIAEEFAMLKGTLLHALLACESGRELTDMGFKEDVFHAAKLDRYDSVPVLLDGAFRRER
jgi:2-phosphosulfolactate phosphatase